MSELAPVAFVLVFVAIVGLAAWMLVRTARRNRAARDPAAGRDLARVAAARGWRYTPVDEEFPRRYDGYPFSRGGPALDLVTGSHRGREFACFQYSPPRALAPGESSAEIDYLRVFAVELPAPVPSALVTPAGAAPRWTRRYTTGDEEFDRAFAVGTEDEPFAGRVLTQPVRQRLLADPPAGPLRFGDRSLLTWRPDRGGFDPHEVVPALDRLCDLVEQLPPDALR
ncbi:hypothetical protein [Actinophytocola gossypii]|uniref:DUF3137 domain-containing protein n=1 Tax=Actinophytocola gossypii TaxID=2812003 RepID=A0ABT2J6T2_9PSEU|nr:hypothetical protein [Actinophytocola gossypii]MCT2583559.1 hypothetical protein [Actinophytocola gossypii]